MLPTKQSEILVRQKPLGTRLSATTTAAEVMKEIPLQGKTAIVTGGYSGLGTETMRVLRFAGADVIAPARDTARARAALARPGHPGSFAQPEECGARSGHAGLVCDEHYA